MSEYKILKRDDRYYKTYKAILYKKYTFWRWSFWLDMEIAKGKEWWVDSAIEHWTEKYNIPQELIIDKTEI